MPLDVTQALDLVSAAIGPGTDRRRRMQAVADALWRTLGLPTGGPISWVGFYLPSADGSELVLGPSRDKPACSPIGLHGVCGQAFLSREPQVIADVRRLGPNYVACDPRDMSEIVLPLVDDDGQCVAVLDLDSHDLGAFSTDDVAPLQRVLRAAGLG